MVNPYGKSLSGIELATYTVAGPFHRNVNAANNSLSPGTPKTTNSAYSCLHGTISRLSTRRYLVDKPRRTPVRSCADPTHHFRRTKDDSRVLTSVCHARGFSVIRQLVCRTSFFFCPANNEYIYVYYLRVVPWAQGVVLLKRHR